MPWRAHVPQMHVLPREKHGFGPSGGRIVRILKEFEQLEGAAGQMHLRVCSFFARIIRVWAIQGAD